MNYKIEFAFKMDGSVFALLKEEGSLKPSRWTGKGWESANFGPADLFSDDAEMLSEAEIDALASG